MALTAADVLIETIHDWGVEVVFGLPGFCGASPTVKKSRSPCSVTGFAS
jgi:hypothetical protein